MYILKTNMQVKQLTNEMNERNAQMEEVVMLNMSKEDAMRDF